MLYTDQFIRLSAEDFSHMTSRTIIFLEKVVSGDFICGDGIFLSFQITVEAWIRSQQCLFELLNSICDILFAQSVGIYFVECYYEILVFCQFADDLIEWLASHFYRIQWRAGSLFCQSSGTSVPELNKVIGSIVYGRGIDTAQLTAYSFRILLVVNATGIQAMTAGTWNGVVCR